MSRCSSTITVPLVLDDYDGPTPHEFPCRLEAGHFEEHEAVVVWLDGEED